MAATLSQTVRSAPDGARVAVTLPPGTAPLTWHAYTRLGGPSFLRAFDFAQAGQHRVIPKKIFPGGRAETFRRQGFDLVVYEAADRSDSCLVWAGPYNEATTWFGGPLPRRSYLNRVLSSVVFADAPEGATLGAASALRGLQQFGTFVYAAGEEVLLTVKDARTAREQVPSWQGARQGEAEVWKEKLALDPGPAAELSGTPYEWRYIVATSTAVVEMTFPRNPATQASARDADGHRRVDALVAGIRAQWTA
jgi:hypothetical protein